MPKTEWKSICAACAEGTAPGRCAYYGDPNGCNAPTLGTHPEGELAEQLQEALEKAERRIAELERAPGNAAAMREALVKIEKLNHYDLACIRSEKSRRSFDAKILDIELAIRAALAAPARNCDVGTAEEQEERHGRFCAAHYKADAVDAQCFGCPASDKKETACEFVWGQLPFAPAQGGAKCVNGLRGEPDCRGCNEHCEDVRKRNCFYWNPDIEGGVCALTGKKSCPISCDNFHIPEKVSPPPAEGEKE